MALGEFRRIVNMVKGEREAHREEGDGGVANLRLVIPDRCKYTNRGLQSVLIQEGNIGLMKAVDKFGDHRHLRLQVLDLCDVVDPPGDPDRRRSAHDPRSGA